jgi:Ca2+-binding RTX toxin-like protein
MQPAHRIRSASLTAALVVATLATASPAAADITCSLTGNTLSVQVGPPERLYMMVDGATSEINMWSLNQGVLVTCSGGQPTTSNVDEIIATADPGGAVTLTVAAIDRFSSPTDPTDEIKFTVDLSSASTSEFVMSLAEPAHVGIGTDGINHNVGAEAFDDIDVELTGVPSVFAFGTVGADVISADGAGGTGLPMPSGSRVALFGNAGDDQLIGGQGDDGLVGDAGDDKLDGGDGRDRVFFTQTLPGVDVDLAAGTAVGEGEDALASVESVWGTDGADTLRGDDGDNLLVGAGGDDELEGRGGDDALRGDAGIDTVSYVGAPAGVRVSLAVSGPQDTSGAGTDELHQVERVIGSAFDDDLLGDAGANELSGLAGDDTFAPGAGDDRVAGGSGRDAVSFASSPGPVNVSLAARLATGDGTDRLTGIEDAIGTRRADVFEASAAADRFDGRGGSDTVSYARAGRGVTADLALVGPQATGGSGRDTLLSIESLIGSRFADILRGNAAANRLVGGRGDDRLEGRAGADVLDGGRDVDLCLGGPGRDRLVSCERS